jgi:acetolactate synthase-1/2/3 large subunit
MPTVVERMATTLAEAGVERIYGLPGGEILDFIDAARRAGIEFVLTRDETTAAFIADAEGFLTGRPAVCVSTLGPGATNLVTGLATAYMDSVPMVAITGQVKTFLIGNDAFQEADITGITRPITKHNYLVEDVKDLARIVKEGRAFERKSPRHNSIAVAGWRGRECAP